jgi:hypothetical protein
MVARFAEMMFLGGISFDLDTAVEQLTLLWANSLGIKYNAARSARSRSDVA